MLWIPLILISALCLGLYDSCKKHAVHDNSVMPVLFLASLSGTVGLVATLTLTGTLAAALPLSSSHWWLVFIKTLLVSSSWILAYYAMRELPLSIAAPIRATAPLWTLAGAVFFFHERLSLLQAIGMGVILICYVLFSAVGKKEGISFHRHRGVWLAFLATLIAAASALFDKHLLRGYGIPKLNLQLWFSLDLLMVLGFALLIRKSLTVPGRPFHWRWSIPAVGLLLVAADWFYFWALSLPETQIAVLSLVRRSSVIVSFTASALVYRDLHLRQKGWVLVGFLIGLALLCMG